MSMYKTKSSMNSYECYLRRWRMQYTPVKISRPVALAQFWTIVMERSFRKQLAASANLNQLSMRSLIGVVVLPPFALPGLKFLAVFAHYETKAHVADTWLCLALGRGQPPRLTCGAKHKLKVLGLTNVGDINDPVGFLLNSTRSKCTISGESMGKNSRYHLLRTTQRLSTHKSFKVMTL